MSRLKRPLFLFPLKAPASCPSVQGLVMARQPCLQDSPAGRHYHPSNIYCTPITGLAQGHTVRVTTPSWDLQPGLL